MITRSSVFAAMVISTLILGLLLSGCSSKSGSSAPSTAATPGVAAGEAGQTQFQGIGGSPRTGEGSEGGEGGGGGEGREGAAATQHLAITITDSAIQPATLTARTGLIAFDFTNQGQTAHHVTIAGSGVSANALDIAPGQTTSLQGNLSPGSYKIAVDANSAATPGPSATLTVQ